jgi:hypothetical protein
MKKLKITSLVIVAALMSVAAGVLWNNYPLESSPLGSETLLVGNSVTNHRWLISDMYILTRSNANRGMQAGSGNLTNWSALDPSAKQDASANLDLWSATTPSAYQLALGYTAATTNFATLSVPGLILPDGVTLTIDPTTHKLSSVSGGSGTLTGPGSVTAGNVATWSSVTGLADSGHALSEYALSGITNSWPWQALNQPLTANGTAWSLLATSAKQDASANLSLWSSFTPVNYTNSLYGLFQPVLGFTPLTFQQTSNLILDMTVPLDSLASNGVITIFGVDQGTNKVSIHLAANLSFASDGVGGYNLSASGSGGTASALPFTNIWPASSNLVLIDLAISKDWEIGVITNNPYRFTNIYSLTNLPPTARINFHGSTNGMFAPTIIDVAGGIMKSNSSSWFPTNASAEATLEVALDWTKTNLLTQWRTNFLATTASTNSSTGPGGGGGGGITLITTASKVGTGSGTTTTDPADTTGAAGFVMIVRAGTPADSGGLTWTQRSTPAGTPSQAIYTAFGAGGAGHTFSTSGGNSIIVYAISGVSSFDVEAHAGATGNWAAVPIQTGLMTPTASASFSVVSAVYNLNVGSNPLSVDSSYTVLTPSLWGASFGLQTAYKIKASNSAENPTLTDLLGSNPDATAIGVIIK